MVEEKYLVWLLSKFVLEWFRLTYSLRTFCNGSV